MSQAAYCYIAKLVRTIGARRAYRVMRNVGIRKDEARFLLLSDQSPLRSYP